MTPAPKPPAPLPRRRFLRAGGATVLASLAPPAWAASEITLLEAINQSGRQRMLSQRMAKFYAQTLRKVREDEAQRKLTSSMKLFSTQLETLQRHSSARSQAALGATLGKLEEAWGRYAAALQRPPSLASLSEVAQLNESVLGLAHEATLQLEKLSASSVGQLVNISGRQRMLSQRMAKFYFFCQCGLDAAEFRQGLDKARGEFVSALAKLRAAPENTQSIKDWIAVGEQQWMFFDDALRGIDSRVEAERNVAITAENLLEVMDKLTGLYTLVT